MARKLQIADGLALPVDAATQVMAFIGRRGNGKSYAAQKLCELLLDARAQAVALDPVGNWYGLRIAADGKGKGYSIPVFGGLHGDLPIDHRAGKMIADLIVDRDLSAVVDVSQMILSEQTQFAYDFATQLFQRKKQSPSAIHLFIEECQEFAPQDVASSKDSFSPRMLHAFERMVKLGRNFGIGCSLISQRPQEVNKKVLNQAECLFVFQLVAKHEREAIRGWVQQKGIDESFIQELSTLKRGSPYIWSPQWLEVFGIFRILGKTTYDASSTPKVGAKRVEPKQLSPIDMQKIQDAMTATIEQSKANDPKELKAKVAKLQQQIVVLEKQAAQAKPAETVETKKPVFTAADRHELKRVTAMLEKVEKSLGENTERLADRIKGAQLLIDGINKRVDARLPVAPVRPIAQRPQGMAPPARSISRPAKPLSAPPKEAGDVSIKGAEQNVLDSLEWWSLIGIDQPKRAQCAFMAGYTVNGHFNNTLGGLRSKGLVDYPAVDHVSLTDAGAALANQPESAATLDELHNKIRRRITNSAQKVLDVLIAARLAGEGPLPSEDLASRAGYTVNGHFNNIRGHLRSLQMVEYQQGGTIASDVLFPPGLA